MNGLDTHIAHYNLGSNSHSLLREGNLRHNKEVEKIVRFSRQLQKAGATDIQIANYMRANTRMSEAEIMEVLRKL